MTSTYTYLDSLRVDTRVLSERLARLKECSLGQLRRKPGPESWSALECIEHLALTSDAYHPVIRRTIDEAPVVDTPVTYRPSLLGRLFVKAVSPDPKLKVKTLEMVTPPKDDLDETTLDRFSIQLGELDTLLVDAARCDINAVRIRSPLNKRLRLRLGEALTVIVRHAQRHLQQAERALEQTEPLSDNQ